MGNQHTNDIYKQYFNPEPRPLMGQICLSHYHQLRLATQEEPLEEEESKDEDALREQFLRASFHQVQVINVDDDSKEFTRDVDSVLYPGSILVPDLSCSGVQRDGLTDIMSQLSPRHECSKQISVKLEDGLPYLQICIEDDSLTCGWLLSEVTRRYALLIDQKKKQRLKGEQSDSKIKKKIIAAIKSQDANESLDFWLTLYNRTVSALWDGLRLEVHFSKIIPNKTEQVCMNDFQLLKVIGKGGFSKVFLVRKKDTGLLFAMKVMQKNFVMTDGKYKQVMCERKIMESLDHPFIVKLHWAFQSRDELNFVMDLCAGGELFYYLHQHGRMSEAQAKFYFAEILLGLEYIHSKGIVYRDLKPENVLLDIDGHLKLADFGLSKNLPSPDSLTNSFCGSPEYMSPEMLIGSGHGFAVDYYSLGAILFEMLTGLPPFYSTERDKMYHDIVEAELHYPPYLSQVVIDLLKKLLSKDQSQRLSFQHIDLIKRHPWCKNIIWEDIMVKKIHPPWLPDITKSNFDPDYTSLPVDLKDFSQSPVISKSKIGTRRQLQRSVYCCVDNSGMTSFYDSRTIGDSSALFYNHNSGYFDQSSSNQFLNMYSSRGRLLEKNNYSQLIKSPKNKELDKVLDQMFKGFSFYSEPKEETEVQRQIKEYLKMKRQFKKKLFMISKQIKDQSKDESSKINSRLDMPPKPEKMNTSQMTNGSKLLLNSIKQAAQQSHTPIKNDNQQHPFKKQEQSSIMDEEVSIAQEFSRADDDSDIDERPKVSQEKKSKFKINTTTEGSITRANNIHSKIFEHRPANSYTMSPSAVFNNGSQITTAKQNYSIMRNHIKSTDNTPFQNMRRNNITENNSVIGQSLFNLDNSHKKPKFLQKFSQFLTKEDHKKNLLEDFSPIQPRIASYQQQNTFQAYTSNSQWHSPSKENEGERKTFISDQSYQTSIMNQKSSKCALSRNNSGAVGMSLSVNANIRTSIATQSESCQQSLLQPALSHSNGTQSLIMTQQKSRNQSQNLGNSQTGHNTVNGQCGVRSQESSTNLKPSLLYQKQKHPQNLNLTPFSVVEMAQNSSNINTQRSLAQKPPRQSQNNSLGQTVSRQPSINYSNQSINMLTSLTAYQRSKVQLPSNPKTFSAHQSLQRKPSNNNETQFSTQSLMQSNTISSQQTSHSQGPKKNNVKVLSSSNVLQSMTNLEQRNNSKKSEKSSETFQKRQSTQNCAVTAAQSQYQSIIEVDGLDIQSNGSFKVIHRTFSKESENREPRKGISIGPMTSNRSTFSAGSNQENYYNKKKQQTDKAKVKTGFQMMSDTDGQLFNKKNKVKPYLTLK